MKSSSKSIVILYPGLKDKPIGGLKVIYDYANRLASDNFNVNIIYASFFEHIYPKTFDKLRCILKHLYLKQIRRRKKCSWYHLDKRIKETFVWEYSSNNIPDADIYISTAVSTVDYMMRYAQKDKSKFYFIQDYENFIYNNDSYILNTYKLGCTKIVISNWLKDIVEKITEKKVYIVPNGFDHNLYKLIIPIEDKNKFQISMLYHKREAKDIQTGINALKIVKRHIPELIVNMFGVYDRPKELPEWIRYYKNPTHEKHLEINNTSAIYLGSSKKEGWGLTIGEAMMCGQAVVCTDNLGYKEMAVDGINALISPIGNAELLAENTIRLIKNDELRHLIAKKGLEMIKDFDIEKSYESFNNIISE